MFLKLFTVGAVFTDDGKLFRSTGPLQVKLRFRYSVREKGTLKLIYRNYNSRYGRQDAT